MSRITVPGDGGWTIASAIIGHLPNLLLYGVPGTGKSTFACRHGAPSWYRIYCHEEMSDIEIVGGPSLHDSGTGATVSGHSDGIGLRAWREGKRLVIDEIDKAGGSALTTLLAITENPDTAAYTIPITGETVVPAPGFHVIATMNVDPSELPEALQDRFTVAVEITQPHPEAIKSLPVDLRAAAKVSANLANERRVSIRSWQAFATLRRSLKKSQSATATTQAEHMAALSVFGPVRGQEVVDALRIARDGADPDALAKTMKR